MNNKTSILIFSIITLAFWEFREAFSIFLQADDFYNIRLIQVNTIPEVIKSFLFVPNEAFLFYRPLSTQFYFFLTYYIFGFSFTAEHYHMINFLLFAGLLILIQLLFKEIGMSMKFRLIGLFLYATASSHLIRLSWIAQIQELLLGLCALSCLYFWFCWQNRFKVKDIMLSLLFFVLALMSKETALVLAAVLPVTTVIWRYKMYKKQHFTGIVFILSLAICYTYLRFAILGISTGAHYFTSVQPYAILNTLLWYLLWSIGFPEFLVNFSLLSKKSLVNHQLINEVNASSVDASFLMMAMILSLMILIIVGLWHLYVQKKHRQANLKQFFYGAFFFVLTLSPLLFSPWHKFTYELTLPLFGMILLLMSLLNNLIVQKKTWLTVICTAFIFVFVIFNFSMVRLEQRKHWVFLRSTITSNVIAFLNAQNDKPRAIYFADDIPIRFPGYGLSKQISFALSNQSGLQLFYNNPSFKTYYQASGDRVHEALILPSSLFLPDEIK